MATNKIIQHSYYSPELSQLAKDYDIRFFDLDDVILTPKDQYYCGTSWINKNAHKILELFNHLVTCSTNTSYRAVSQQMNEDFAKIHDQHKIYGLTARDIIFSKETYDHYTSTGMKFSNLDVEHPLIDKGVIYASKRIADKGTILLDILNNGILGEVKSIIFFDDMLYNLEDVAKALENTDIDFLGIHLTTVSDEQNSTYTQEELDHIGHTQLEIFGQCGYIPTNNDVMSGNIKDQCMA
jgi:hypothetical protein